MLIVASRTGIVIIVITISPPGALELCSLSLLLLGHRWPSTPLVDSIITVVYAPSPASRPQYFIYMSQTERGREVGVNQDVVRERGKDIRVADPPDPAGVTHHNTPIRGLFIPPTATQRYTNTIAITGNAFGACHLQMMRQWPLNCHYSSPRCHHDALPAAPFTRCMKIDAIEKPTSGN